MNIREDEIDLVPYLNACSIGEFKITPTVSLFENEEVVLLHVCARQGQTKVNFDLWPYYKLTFKDILDLPMPIVNVRFVIPYILVSIR